MGEISEWIVRWQTSDGGYVWHIPVHDDTGWGCPVVFSHQGGSMVWNLFHPVHGGAEVGSDCVGMCDQQYLELMDEQSMCVHSLPVEPEFCLVVVDQILPSLNDMHINL